MSKYGKYVASAVFSGLLLAGCAAPKVVSEPAPPPIEQDDAGRFSMAAAENALITGFSTYAVQQNLSGKNADFVLSITNLEDVNPNYDYADITQMLATMKLAGVKALESAAMKRSGQAEYVLSLELLLPQDGGIFWEAVLKNKNDADSILWRDLLEMQPETISVADAGDCAAKPCDAAAECASAAPATGCPAAAADAQ